MTTKKIMALFVTVVALMMLTTPLVSVASAYSGSDDPSIEEFGSKANDIGDTSNDLSIMIDKVKELFANDEQITTLFESILGDSGFASKLDLDYILRYVEPLFGNNTLRSFGDIDYDKIIQNKNVLLAHGIMKDLLDSDYIQSLRDLIKSTANIGTLKVNELLPTGNSASIAETVNITTATTIAAGENVSFEEGNTYNFTGDGCYIFKAGSSFDTDGNFTASGVGKDILIFEQGSTICGNTVPTTISIALDGTAKCTLVKSIDLSKGTVSIDFEFDLTGTISIGDVAITGESGNELGLSADLTFDYLALLEIMIAIESGDYSSIPDIILHNDVTLACELDINISSILYGDDGAKNISVHATAYTSPSTNEDKSITFAILGSMAAVMKGEENTVNTGASMIIKSENDAISHDITDVFFTTDDFSVEADKILIESDNSVGSTTSLAVDELTVSISTTGTSPITAKIDNLDVIITNDVPSPEIVTTTELSIKIDNMGIDIPATETNDGKYVGVKDVNLEITLTQTASPSATDDNIKLKISGSMTTVVNDKENVYNINVTMGMNLIDDASSYLNITDAYLITDDFSVTVEKILITTTNNSKIKGVADGEILLEVDKMIFSIPATGTTEAVDITTDLSVLLTLNADATKLVEGESVPTSSSNLGFNIAADVSVKSGDMLVSIDNVIVEGTLTSSSSPEEAKSNMKLSTNFDSTSATISGLPIGDIKINMDGKYEKSLEASVLFPHDNVKTIRASANESSTLDATFTVESDNITAGIENISKTDTTMSSIEDGTFTIVTEYSFSVDRIYATIPATPGYDEVSINIENVLISSNSLTTSGVQTNDQVDVPTTSMGEASLAADVDIEAGDFIVKVDGLDLLAAIEVSYEEGTHPTTGGIIMALDNIELKIPATETDDGEYVNIDTLGLLIDFSGDLTDVVDYTEILYMIEPGSIIVAKSIEFGTTGESEMNIEINGFEMETSDYDNIRYLDISATELIANHNASMMLDANLQAHGIEVYLDPMGVYNTHLDANSATLSMTVGTSESKLEATGLVLQIDDDSFIIEDGDLEATNWILCGFEFKTGSSISAMSSDVKMYDLEFTGDNYTANVVFDKQEVKITPVAGYTLIEHESGVNYTLNADGTASLTEFSGDVIIKTTAQTYTYQYMNDEVQNIECGTKIMLKVPNAIDFYGWCDGSKTIQYDGTSETSYIMPARNVHMTEVYKADVHADDIVLEGDTVSITETDSNIIHIGIEAMDKIREETSGGANILSVAGNGFYTTVDIATISPHSEITLSQRVVESFDNPVLDAAVGDNLAISIEMVDEKGTKIHNFGSAAIGVQIPDSWNKDAINAYYMDQYGFMEPVDGHMDMIDDKSYFVIETNHFSYYVLEDVHESDDNDDNTMLIVAVVVVIVAIVAIVAFVFFKRRDQ